jgi:hypothetical protein
MSQWDAMRRELDARQDASCVQLVIGEHAHEREKALLSINIQNMLKGLMLETEATDDVS